MEPIYAYTKVEFFTCPQYSHRHKVREECKYRVTWESRLHAHAIYLCLLVLFWLNARCIILSYKELLLESLNLVMTSWAIKMVTYPFRLLWNLNVLINLAARSGGRDSTCVTPVALQREGITRVFPNWGIANA